MAAKARGRLGGRPEKYGYKDIEMMKALIDGGTPIKGVAERWGVSRTTIYRYLGQREGIGRPWLPRSLNKHMNAGS